MRRIRLAHRVRVKVRAKDKDTMAVRVGNDGAIQEEEEEERRGVHIPKAGASSAMASIGLQSAPRTL